MRRAALPVVAVLLAGGLLLVGLNLMGEDYYDQLNRDCQEHLGGVASAGLGWLGPEPVTAATACGGLLLNDRIYPNLLPVHVDITSLERTGDAQAVVAGERWALTERSAYRMPEVPEEVAVIVVVTGAGLDGPVIAWRAPFPVAACSLLDLRLERPKECPQAAS